MKEELKWWRRFWPLAIVVCSSLIVVECILYLLGYIDLLMLLGGILVVLVAIPLTYGSWYLGTKFETSKKIQLSYKIAFIVGFGFIATVITFFGTAFIIWAVEGMPKPGNPPPQYARLRLILLFVVPWVVGAFIGYLVGKRRNFRPYI